MVRCTLVLQLVLTEFARFGRFLESLTARFSEKTQNQLISQVVDRQCNDRQFRNIIACLLLKQQI